MIQQQEFNFDAKPDLNVKEARRLRDEGIETAVAHANKVEPRWIDKAYEYFKNHFLLSTNGAFQMEEFRSYCAMMDFPLPAHNRAFGGVVVRAVKEGIIKSVGKQATRSKKSHCANAELWIQVKPSQIKK
jgi:hypothetical protein